MKLMTENRLLAAAALCLFFQASASAQQAPKDALLSAAAAELERSFARLKDAEKIPLYYLSYEISDVSDYGLSSSMGDISTESSGRRRTVDVDARVGSMPLDNTHQIKGDSAGERWGAPSRYELPLEDDEAAVRTQLWLSTDKEYKTALQRYMKVEMNKAVTTDEENPAPDFSAAPVENFYESTAAITVDAAAWKEKLRALSAECRKQLFVHSCSVELTARALVKVFVSSEGSRIRTAQNFVRLGYAISSRAEDGMELTRNRYYDAASLEGLPAQEQVATDLQVSIGELKALREASLVQPYSGPVILKNRASAVFFHEIFGHRVEGHRQKLEREGQTFAKMLDKKVCSELISVYDDPTMEQRNGKFLRGFYKYDDEGVKAARVDLVKEGLLAGFLLSRSPIQGFPVSNGHGRRSPGRPVVARQGNLVVEASKTVSYEKLREMLIEECKKQRKPYGLIFDDISGGFTMTGRSGPQSFKVLPLLVYRVYADGRPDELVRGVDIVGTPLASFTKISAAADDEDVFNGTCGAESGWVPVSAISPSLLISEMEVEKTRKTHEKPPLLPSPFSENGVVK